MNARIVAAITALCLFASFAISGCGKSDEKPESPGQDAAKESNAATAETSNTPQPGTEDGARELLMQFLQPGADGASLTRALRPTGPDFAATFVNDAASKAQIGYDPAWESGEMVIAPKEGQTELKLWGVTTADLKAWTGNAAEFPGGYKDIAGKFKDGLTIYRFKFVAPGEDLGMAFDGLVHVNGHWVIFPKPWRVIQ